MELQDIEGPGVGFFPKNTFGVGWNRTGATLALGDIVMCDEADTDAGTTTTLVLGNDGAVYGNFITPGTNGIGALSGGTYIAPFAFGVVVDLLADAGADDTKVRVQWQGIVKAKWTATAATVGLAGFPANGVRTLTVTATAGVRPIAKVWEPNGSSAGSYLTWFDGINGCGGGCAAS